MAKKQETIEPVTQSLEVEDSTRDIKEGAEAVALTQAQLKFLKSLQTSGVEPKVLQQLQQQLTQNPALTENLQEWCAWMKSFKEKLSQFELEMADTHRILDKNPQAQREQAHIDKNIKLRNYQRRVEKELSTFLMCYFLAPAGIFMLDNNKKDTALNLIGSIPIAGQFLKILTSGFSFANKKYRNYKINRINEQFNTFDHITETCRRFACQLALINEGEIEKLVAPQYEGIDKVKGLYHYVKDELEQQWKDLASSDKTRVTLLPEDKRAMLDCAYLLQQILSGEAKVDNTQDLVPQFIKVIKGQTYTPPLLSSCSPFRQPRMTVTPIPNLVSNTSIQTSSGSSTNNMATLSEVEALRQLLATHDTKQKAIERQLELQAEESARREREFVELREFKKKMEQAHIALGGGNQAQALMPNFASGADSIDTSLLYQHNHQIQTLGKATQILAERMGVDLHLTVAPEKTDEVLRKSLGVSASKKK